jgi:hypothetical protein
MRRLLHVVLVFGAAGMMAAFGGLGACGSPSGGDAGPKDSGSAADAGPTGGTITTASSNNALPPAWSGPIAAFKSDNTGAGSAYVSQIVKLTDSTTSTVGSGQCGATGFPSCSTCPTNFVFTSTTSGKSYCDGFTATAAGGGVAYADTFAYVSSTTACAAQFNNATNATIRGVWNDHFNSSNSTDTYSIALTNCSDVGVGAAYAGTGTPRPGTVGALLANLPAEGATVTVTGVVVAAWSASGGASFGFALEDASGAPNSGIAVGKDKTSASTAAPVNIGDDVTVMGTFTKKYPPNYKINL